MRFLIIDSDSDYRQTLRYYLEVKWPDAVIAEQTPASSGQLSGTFPIETVDAILLGYPRKSEDGLRWLRELRARRGCPPVLVFAADSDEFLAVDSLKRGAADYFPKSRVTHKRLIESLIGAVARNRDPDARLQSAEDEWELCGVKSHEFIARIHSSELSSVYLAEDVNTGSRLAYKILRHVPDSGGEQLFDRFLQEYEVIASIDHPNVVEIFNLGVADDHAFIAMEYLPGGTLANRLTRALAREAALGYARQIARALDIVHEAGILHRDLKPANIMLRDDGSLALIDFGLAKRMWLEAAISGAGQIFGTPYYMSPEQGHAAAVDARSDIYSLGCILFEMLTGRRPFAAETPMAVIYNHSNAPRPSLPSDFADLQPVLDRMLAVKPADRYQSAAEFLPWLDEVPVSEATA
ncbi:MAG: protein kinase domain-containing protein [Gammaproteobacteria bacterium]